MKKYSDYEWASVSMTMDKELQTLLENIAQKPISIMIETGTYNGLGSTTFLAKSFEQSPHLKTFYTIEVDPYSFGEARKNLAKFPKIECLYGSSVGLQEALDFVRQDEAIANHEKYTDIFIDDTEKPIEFYTRELAGLLVSQKFNWRAWLLALRFPKRQEHLLKKLITQHFENELFIILDSAGGVGFLEFQTTLNLLKNKPFYLLLDDTHHLKHFRSLAHIQADPHFEVLGLSPKNGWCLAKYTP